MGRSMKNALHIHKRWFFKRALFVVMLISILSLINYWNWQRISLAKLFQLASVQGNSVRANRDGKSFSKEALQVEIKGDSGGKSSMVPSVDEQEVEVQEQSEKIHPRFAEYGTNIVWVEGGGSLLERLQDYNDAISEERANIPWQTLDAKQWMPLAGPFKVEWGVDVDTIYKLQNYSFVRTVALKWLKKNDAAWTSLRDHNNLLIQDYYEWVGTPDLCRWIQTPLLTKHRYSVIYNSMCNTDPAVSLRATSLEKVYFHSKVMIRRWFWPNNGTKFPEHYYTTLPRHVFYVHIVQNVVIDVIGNVFVSNIKIEPLTCSHFAKRKSTLPPGFMNTSIHNEVFIINQLWGKAFFHKMAESIPRIAPYLEFLKQNPTIPIHVGENTGLTAKILDMLGINPARLISGVCRAKVVYLPQGTYCGFPHVQEMQLLSHIYRGIISETFPQTERNSVVVIRRSRGRKLSQYQEIEDVVKALADRYNFRFELYPDNPMPSFEEAMQMFNRAVMVVGPHGGGLSNLVFSQPGTVVIEGVCNPPHVNMCYQRTAHILGHRYHGVASQGGCEKVIEIQPTVIGDIVETHMKLVKPQPPEN